MWRLYKSKLICLIFAVVLLVASGVYAGYRFGKDKDTPEPRPDVAANTHSGTVHTEANDLNSLQCYNPHTAKQGTFIHHMFTDLSFKADSIEQKLPAKNDSENTLSMTVDLFLSSGEDSQGEELLFHSGVIAPGQTLSDVILLRELDAGEYKAKLYFTPVDENGNTYGSTVSNIIIHVQ